MRFILSIKIPVITPPTTFNWVCYTKTADQGIEILIIQDSDLELGTQEYFQFSVYSPSWGNPMPHFDRKLLISGSSVFSKTSLNIWKFMVHILLKPGLENFEHYFTSVWYECNCAVVWAFFGIAFLWDWDENWPFPVLRPLLSFPNLLAYWVQHLNSIIF